MSEDDKEYKEDKYTPWFTHKDKEGKKVSIHIPNLFENVEKDHKRIADLEDMQETIVETDPVRMDERIEKLEKKIFHDYGGDLNKIEDAAVIQIELVKQISEVKDNIDSNREQINVNLEAICWIRKLVLKLNKQKIFFWQLKKEISELKEKLDFCQRNENAIRETMKELNKNRIHEIYKNREILQLTLKRLANIFNFSINNSQFFEYQLYKLEGKDGEKSDIEEECSMEESAKCMDADLKPSNRIDNEGNPYQERTSGSANIQEEKPSEPEDTTELQTDPEWEKTKQEYYKEPTEAGSKSTDSTHLLVQCPKCNYKWLIKKESDKD